MHGGCLRSLTEECETSVLGDGRERILIKLMTSPLPALWSAGDTGRATILTGRDLGKDGRQSRRCRGQTRREAGRARLHQQTLRTQIRPALVSRPRQHHLNSLFGWCINYHSAQKGTLDRAETIRINIRSLIRGFDRERTELLSLTSYPLLSFALSPLSRLCYSWCGLRYIFDFCFSIRRSKCCASVCSTRGGRWCRRFWIKHYESALNYKTEYVSLTYGIQDAVFMRGRGTFAVSLDQCVDFKGSSWNSAMQKRKTIAKWLTKW